MSPNIPDKYYRRVPYNIHELDEHRGVKLHGPFPADSPLARFYKQDEAALIELVYQNVLHEKGQREVNQAFKQALSHKKKKRMAIAEEFCRLHGVPVDNVAELTPEAKNAMRVPNDMRMPIFVMLCILAIVLATALLWISGGPFMFEGMTPAPSDMGFGFAVWFGVYFWGAGLLCLIYGLWVKQYSLREVWGTDPGLGAITIWAIATMILIASGVVWLFSVSIIPWIIVFGLPKLLNLLRGANKL